MERYQTIRAFSAGGVVFRLNAGGAYEEKSTSGTWESAQYSNMSIEVVLVGRSHSGIWALPKGTPESGETLEQVAVREVQEETGLKVRLITYIGNITYSFVHDRIRYQKQVRHFLFEAIGGDTSLHDAEYDRVEWFSIPEALRRLTYQNEVNILSQADDILHRWLQIRQKEG